MTCNCPRIDGYILKRKSCNAHPNRPTLIGNDIIAAPSVDEDLVYAWADYRKDYGIPADQMTAAHKAFRAGWEAARLGDQSGALR